LGSQLTPLLRSYWFICRIK